MLVDYEFGNVIQIQRHFNVRVGTNHSPGIGGGRGIKKSTRLTIFFIFFVISFITCFFLYCGYHIWSRKILRDFDYHKQNKTLKKYIANFYFYLVETSNTVKY